MAGDWILVCLFQYIAYQTLCDFKGTVSGLRRLDFGLSVSRRLLLRSLTVNYGTRTLLAINLTYIPGSVVSLHFAQIVRRC